MRWTSDRTTSVEVGAHPLPKVSAMAPFLKLGLQFWPSFMRLINGLVRSQQDRVAETEFERYEGFSKIALARTTHSGIFPSFISIPMSVDRRPRTDERWRDFGNPWAIWGLLADIGNCSAGACSATRWSCFGWTELLHFAVLRRFGQGAGGYLRQGGGRPDVPLRPK